MSLSNVTLPELNSGMRWKLKRYATSSSILILQKRVFGFWVMKNYEIILDQTVEKTSVQDCLDEATDLISKSSKGASMIKPYYGSK